MIEKLILERYDLEEAAALYMVVNGTRHHVCSTSYDETGNKGLDMIEEVAGNITRYTNIYLEEHYPPEIEE